MADTFSCPQCGVFLRRSPALIPGVLVKCPKCSQQFRVPALEAPALPSLELDDTPEEPVRPPARPPKFDSPFTVEDAAGARPPAIPRAGSEPERPRRERAIDEDEDVPRLRRERDPDDDEDRPRRRRQHDLDDDDEDRPRRGGRLDTLPLDHPLDIGKSFELAKSCWGEYVGPAIGFAFLAPLILFPVALLTIIPIFGHLVYFIIASALMRGPQIVALRAVRGKNWTFSDFFSGFKFFGHFLGLAFFQGLLAFVAYIPALILLIISAVMSSNGPGGVIMGIGLIASACVGLPIYLYLDARLFTFALQLIVHKKLGLIEAMQGCWRLSEGRVLQFVGLNLLFVLTAISGIVVCIGTLLTIPLAHLFVASAYTQVMNIPTAESDRPRRRSRRDLEEEDDDDRPRRRPRRDEDDEDDRPRPRKLRPADDY